jgi:SAM-dependent methyltransferase
VTRADAAPAEWAADELETLEACPVCHSPHATVLHDRLKDYVFSAAGGHWRLVSCGGCGVAYLNPRPSPATIGRAYATYYTHGGTTPPRGARLGVKAWLRRALANGYRDAIYGTRLRPTLGPLGALVAQLSPSFRNAIENESPGLVGVRPKRLGQSKVLDVGCGNGLSLLRARDAGWHAIGVEPDPDAVATASARGMEVIAPRIDDVPASFNGSFERILLSHVIEHVHDPLAMLRHCHRLLEPGGTLWMETPNLSSFGHASFGADWRGLEPPRHLVLFRPDSLEALLKEAGFDRIRHSRPREVWVYLFHHSIETQRKRVAEESTAVAAPPTSAETLAHYLRRARDAVSRTPAQAEFITVVATAHSPPLPTP